MGAGFDHSPRADGVFPFAYHALPLKAVKPGLHYPSPIVTIHLGRLACSPVRIAQCRLRR